MSFKISKKEVHTRLGYIFLGIFTVYLVTPLEMWITAHSTVSPWVIGLAGLALTLYLFKFD